MKYVLAVLLALVFAAPASATPEAVALVQVTRDGDTWTADYQLLEQAPVWAFAKSILPRVSKTSWRAGTVQVLTPGVRLKRIGNFDALESVKGPLPAHVRLRFTPYVEDIEAGYDAALAFGDGSVALYANQFKLVPLKSAAALAALPPDESSLPAVDQPTRMTFADREGPVLAEGKRKKNATFQDGEAYILFGRAHPVIGPAMTTIMDPALPQWIPDYLNAELPRILGYYREKLGPSPMGQPSLLVSWAGLGPEKVSLSGSVLPGMVVMTLKGEGLLKPDGKVSAYARSFVAHEAAHFWLGQSVHYSHPRESWITEGGAELLAFRATAAADPAYDIKARLSEAKQECLPFLAKGGIASAYEREDDFRAYYACGAIIALAAEKASGGDFADFVSALIEQSAGDQTVTREEWLALLEQRAPGGTLSSAVAKLLDERQPYPARALDEFIGVAGISDQFATARPPA